MSALARYFLHEGKQVAGYDRTPTALTRSLEREGAAVHYEDGIEMIPEPFRDKASTLVVRTPAVPADHSELNYFIDNGFMMVKRSQMLGVLSQGKYVMAIAGTHGKTTTTTLTAWLNCRAGVDAGCSTGNCSVQDNAASGSKTGDTGDDAGGAGCGSAFLGGISVNFGSNLVLGRGRRLAVEADEFDRSFLQLYPDVALITSADADHLDIYGTHEAVKEAFSQFIRQIKPGGTLIIKRGADVVIDNRGIKVWKYALDGGTDKDAADFHASGIALTGGGRYRFDIVCPDRIIRDCELGVPGMVNIENCVGAVAMLWVAGFNEAKLREAIREFRGVKRRFEIYIDTPQRVYMDDYAHHPAELEAALRSVRGMFPGRRVTAVFQPHLYSRTNDFYPQFASALSLADEVVLLPIYPAREEPIEGVTSELIAGQITVPCRTVLKERIAEEISKMETDIVVTFGAGDIENYCKDIAEALKR